jgi:hypothetical protein
MPYQAMAMIARMRAGMFAPHTPKLNREKTGKGMPVRWPAYPIQFIPMKMIVKPTSRETSTCQAESPMTNSPAAKV